MTRRLLSLLIAAALVTSACAGNEGNIEIVAPDTASTTTSAPSTAAPETVAPEGPVDDTLVEDTERNERSAPDDEVIVVVATTDPDAPITTTTTTTIAEPAAAGELLGQQVNLSGDTDLVLWFWAPW